MLMQVQQKWPLKVPITTAADDFFDFFFFLMFLEKTSPDISCESSAWPKQMIHMNSQDLFSLKNKKKKKKKNLNVVCYKFCFKG